MDANESLDPSERCDEALENTFNACINEAERILVAGAIALVLPAQRPLKLRELHGALAQYTILWHLMILDMDHSMFKQWFDTKSELFTRGENDTVRFSDPAMPTYLRETAIRNVDTTHYTIALLCHAQMQRYRFLSTVLPYSYHAFWFLEYAERYRRHHMQRAGDFA